MMGKRPPRRLQNFRGAQFDWLASVLRKSKELLPPRKQGFVCNIRQICRAVILKCDKRQLLLLRQNQFSCCFTAKPQADFRSVGVKITKTGMVAANLAKRILPQGRNHIA